MLWPFYPCSPKMPWLMPCKQPGMTVISCGSSMRRSRKPRQSCRGLSPREMQKWHSGEPSMRLMPFRELRSWKMPSELRGLQCVLDWQDCAHRVLLCAKEIWQPGRKVPLTQCCRLRLSFFCSSYCLGRSVFLLSACLWRSACGYWGSFEN